jgi:hypothetical protein
MIPSTYLCSMHKSGMRVLDLDELIMNRDPIPPAPIDYDQYAHINIFMHLYELYRPMFRPPGWIQIKQIIHKKLIESFLITVSWTTPWAWRPMGRQST